MAHTHRVIDKDAHFIINPITRAIESQNLEKNKIVQFDHNSERLTFELSRMVEGHDMSLCNTIQIEFTNVSANKNNSNTDVYTVDDLNFDESGDKIIFSWLISKNATYYNGTLSFAIRFACTTNDVVDYEWRTDIYSNISILKSIDVSNSIIKEDPNVIKELTVLKANLGEMSDLQTEDKSSIVSAINEVLASGGSGSAVRYNITYSGDNISWTKNPSSVVEGGALEAVFIVAQDATIKTVSVTMDGADITSTAYNAETKTVTIAEVYGDVSIVVTTVIAVVNTSPKIVEYEKALNNSDGVAVLKYPLACYTEFYPVSGEFVMYLSNVNGTTFGANGKTQLWNEEGSLGYASVLTSYANKETTIFKDGMTKFRTTLITEEIESCYAYDKTTGRIIFAGKDTKYYGMSNISEAIETTTLSVDDDYAMDYGQVATVASIVPNAPTENTLGDFGTVIEQVKTEWMKEYRGNVNKIPIVVHTDQHGRLSGQSTLFEYLNNTLNWYELSKIMNLGDTVSTSWYDVDTSEPLLKDSALESAIEAMKKIPFSKRLDVFGNHDTWYGNYEDEGNTIGTRYPSSQAFLEPYFKNIYARRTNNNGWLTVKDDYFNVKYLVISGFEYKDGSSEFRIGTKQMDFIIKEISENDGYDIVIVSHVPLKSDPNEFVYPTGDTSTIMYKISNIDTDQFFADAKMHRSGTIVDSDGVEHNYDFTNGNRVLCSLHGHTHYDAYLYLNNELLVNAFDWFAEQTFFFVLIDRENNQLNIWKVENPSTGATYQNYQIPFDKD